MTKWGFSQSTSALEHLKINTQNVITISIDYKREPYHHPNGCMPHNRTMIPKCIHALISVTCEYVTRHGRGYFADGIKWGSWGVDINPGLPGWINVITKVHRSGRQENEHEEKEIGWQKQRSERREIGRFYVAGFEHRERGSSQGNWVTSRT